MTNELEDQFKELITACEAEYLVASVQEEEGIEGQFFVISGFNNVINPGPIAAYAQAQHQIKSDLVGGDPNNTDAEVSFSIPHEVKPLFELAGLDTATLEEPYDPVQIHDISSNDPEPK